MKYIYINIRMYVFVGLYIYIYIWRVKERGICGINVNIGNNRKSLIENYKRKLV